MIDKNRKIAEENNMLKTIITDSLQEKETLIKRAIKSDYYAYNTYKEAIESIENGIVCMEECVLICKGVKEDIKKKYLEIEKIKMNNLLKEKNININTNTNKEKIKIFNSNSNSNSNSNNLLQITNEVTEKQSINDKLKLNKNNKENFNIKENNSSKKAETSEIKSEIKNENIFSTIVNIKEKENNVANNKKSKTKKKTTAKTERIRCFRNFQK